MLNYQRVRSQGPKILPTDPWLSHHPHLSMLAIQDQTRSPTKITSLEKMPLLSFCLSHPSTFPNSIPRFPVVHAWIGQVTIANTQLVQWSELKRRTHQQNPREVYMGDMASSENSIAINPLRSHHVPVKKKNIWGISHSQTNPYPLFSLFIGYPLVN